MRADDLPASGPRRPPWRLLRVLAPSGGRRLDRTSDLIGAFAVLLGMALSTSSTIHQWRAHQMTPRDTFIIGVLLPALTLTTGWILTAVLRRRSARPALVVHTGLCLAGVVVAALFWQVTPGQLAPSLAHSAVLAAAAAWTCLAWPFAVLDILATVAIGGTVLDGTDELGSLSWVNSAYYGTIGIVTTMAWMTVVTSVRMAQRADRESRRTEQELIESEEALAESSRWDALIHDKVLNALGSAARAAHPSVAEPVRQLACDALAALAGTGPRSHLDQFDQQIRQMARAIGLDAEVQIEGSPLGRVAESFRRAAGEALTNVARHSGVLQVSVVGRFDDGQGELTVRDRGCGFDPDQVPDNRHGLRGSVRETMAGCGGLAEILSSPGNGTTVTMSWHAPTGEQVRVGQLPAFRAMVGFFILCLLISLSMGVPCSPYVIDWRIEDLGLAILVLSVGAAMCWPRLNLRICTLLAVATMAAQIIMLANLRLTPEPEWQEWFIGFSLGVFAPLAWRTRSRLWWLVAVASLPVVTAGAAILGGHDIGWLMASRASSFSFPVVMSMGAAWAASSMDAALEMVRDRRRRISEAIRWRAHADAVRLETERRLAAIGGDPLVMLERLSAGIPIDAEVRRECAILEASTRDLLVAPHVVSATMHRSFRKARERGATVVMTGVDPVDADRAEMAALFRRVCVRLAGEAGEGVRLTCRWAPRSSPGQATVALSGATPGAAAGVSEILGGGGSAGQVSAEVIADGDDLLVILTVPRTPGGDAPAPEDCQQGAEQTETAAGPR